MGGGEGEGQAGASSWYWAERPAGSFLISLHLPRGLRANPRVKDPNISTAFSQSVQFQLGVGVGATVARKINAAPVLRAVLRIRTRSTSDPTE